MMDHRLRSEEVDVLLRDTLADDLAPEDEARLAAAMLRTWAEVSAAGAMREATTWGPGLGRGWISSAALAASVVLAASGLLLHLSLPPRAVADSLSVRNASLRVASRLRQAVAMACRLDTFDEQGRPLRLRIDWKAPDEAQLRAESEAAPMARTLRVPPDTGGTWVRATGAGARIDGEPLPPGVGDVLGPSRIAGLLDGRWRLAADASTLPGRTVFDVSAGHRAGGVRVTVDDAAFLPVRLEAGWTAALRWTPGEPRLLLGGGWRGSR
jgi:hypothetical protein